MRAPVSQRAFTLVEVLVSMSLGMVVMLAIFSSYLFLGRNLTRLSYQRALETQGRTIITNFVRDVRTAKSVTSLSSSTNTGTLVLKMVDGSTVQYDYDFSTNSSNGLSRNSVALLKDIADAKVSAPVTLQSCTINSYNNTDGSTTYSYKIGSTTTNTTTVVTASIKQLEVKLTLQAGNTTIQAGQGTLNRFQAASGRVSLPNRQLPDGT